MNLSRKGLPPASHSTGVDEKGIAKNSDIVGPGKGDEPEYQTKRREAGKWIPDGGNFFP